MHLALRRYAEPPRDVFQYFGLGAVFTVIVLATVFERLDEVENQEAIAAGLAQRDRQIAKAAATAYVLEAFPRWALDHPDRTCPENRAELDHYVPAAPSHDPWNRPYVIACNPASGFLEVWSVGPDGIGRTSDDVRNR